MSNQLIHETSPYLLQHADNPVDWHPWHKDILTRARDDNRLLIISIGYSSCHWCHVMERESFEDKEVAEKMNANYINIKVDREERPDIDQVYMSAIQLMTGRGGWPLNIVALPDGRPVWGGTYFPKEHWISALDQISKIQQEQPEKLEEYAQRLQQGINQLNDIETKTTSNSIAIEAVHQSVVKWSKQFDNNFGGLQGAPKFMMPVNYKFLLHYGHLTKNTDILNHTYITLDAIASGGIYDQLGGGFARYSTDEKWHIPHFEKMLYDNAQLLSLYSNAYKVNSKPLYKEVVYETYNFLKQEMLDRSGGFYTALDADSLNNQGILEEGAYYVWTKADLHKHLDKGEYDLFASYYNVDSTGYWEEGKYVLKRTLNDKQFCDKKNITQDTLNKYKSNWKNKLLKVRAQRPQPRLDDKVLTSWNALTIQGLIDAYKTFQEDKFLTLALNCAQFIVQKQLEGDKLYRNYKEGKSTINAYLEDYATVIAAFIDLYEVTGTMHWLTIAKRLTTYTFTHFKDEKSTLFYYTSSLDEELITRTQERLDNVIPASNSIMAQNLIKLGHLLTNNEFIGQAKKMIHAVYEDACKYGANYSNWLQAILYLTYPYYEIVVVGQDAKKMSKALVKEYLPNSIQVFTTEADTSLELFKHRYKKEKTYIYICQNTMCQAPVDTVKKALQLIEN